MAERENSKILTAKDFQLWCVTGRLPEAIAEALGNTGSFSEQVVRLLEMLGLLEPVAAVRPGARNAVSYVVREPEVALAASDGTPEEERVFEIRAPIDESIMVELLRITAANVTAQDDGAVSVKAYKVSGFREICLPGALSSEPGTLVSVENVLLCPGAGFEVFALNYNSFSLARFNVEARYWGIP